METQIDYDINHFCLVYDREIDSDLCYESIMCLGKMFKISSLKELEEVSDIEKAREYCEKCPIRSIQFHSCLNEMILGSWSILNF